MTDDSAKRLAELSPRLLRVAVYGVVPDDDQHVIADAQQELERLSALVERQRKALEEIASFTADVPDDHPLSHVHAVAASALGAP